MKKLDGEAIELKDSPITEKGIQTLMLYFESLRDDPGMPYAKKAEFEKVLRVLTEHRKSKTKG